MTQLLTPSKLWEMLEGNRRLTVRVLEAFPEAELFSFTAPGMRTAADLFKEIIEIERAYFHGIATGEWVYNPETGNVTTKQGLLEAFQTLRSQSTEWWSKATEERLLAVEDDKFWGAPPMSNLDRVIYALENEVHHRGQVYVYLRQLGIEPPAFYER